LLLRQRRRSASDQSGESKQEKCGDHASHCYGHTFIMPLCMRRMRAPGVGFAKQDELRAALVMLNP
jgi:hypothetical protein